MKRSELGDDTAMRSELGGCFPLLDFVQRLQYLSTSKDRDLATASHLKRNTKEESVKIIFYMS